MDNKSKIKTILQVADLTDENSGPYKVLNDSESRELIEKGTVTVKRAKVISANTPREERGLCDDCGERCDGFCTLTEKQTVSLELCGVDSLLLDAVTDHVEAETGFDLGLYSPEAILIEALHFYANLIVNDEA